MQVLDYSAGFPGARAIKAAGYVGAVRYIGSPGNRKCATAAELDDFNAHGLGMALVFEQTAGQWRNGFEQGKRDARLARDHADAIGFPRNRPIYMAIDQDVVTEDEFRAMGRYLDGAGEVLGREWVGVYGEGAVCIRAASWGFRWRWQCRAWSGAINPDTGLPYTLDGGRTLYQYYGDGNGGPAPIVGGVQADINDVLQEDWGQHLMEDDMSAAEVWNFPIENPVTGETAPAIEFLRWICAERIGPLVWGHEMENANGDTVAMSTVAHATDKNVAENGAILRELQLGGIDVDAVVDGVATKVLAGLEGKTGGITRGELVTEVVAVLNRTSLRHKDSTQEGGL